MDKKYTIPDDCICKQLTNGDHLTDLQYNSISKLIYDTDPYIYPALFGEGIAGISNACRILPAAFESNMDLMFRKQNLFVTFGENGIVALILWIKGKLQWDPYRFLSLARSEGIELAEKNVLAVGKQYVDNRYEQKSSENNSISLVNVCVEQSLRGCGLGKYILNAFLAAHKHDKMELCVLADNISAIQLYSNAGFSIVQQSTGFSLHGAPPNCFDMIKEDNKSGNGSDCLG